MRVLWAWYRRRRWWGQLLLALAGIPLVAAGLYIGARSLQYAAAEKDAGLFAPQKAQVVLRARDLEGHWARLQKTKAWLALKRRVLRDPSVRRPLNAALGDARLPTLDDLEDVRKANVYSEENLLRAAGRDFMAAVQVGDAWKSATWCAATRLRWSDFLLAPLARFVLRPETVGGRTALALRQGGRDVFIVFEGALAVASNDRALLEDALRRKGSAQAPSRPVEARLEFRGSRALDELRTTLAKTGLFPHVKADTARGLELSADALGKSGEAISLDLLFAGAEAASPSAPPHAFAGFAPPAASGALASQIGLADLYAWLQSLIDRSGKGGFVSVNAAQAVEQLEKAGFSRTFLPRVDRGMVLLTGIEDRGGRGYPTFALLVAAADGKGATAALTSVIRSIAGPMAEARFRESPVLDTVMYSWEWPKALRINDYLTPCYAALEGGFVFGNNAAFTEAVIHASRGGERFQGERLWRDLQGRMKAYGFAAEPGAAGGWAFLPRFRESLDGLLPRIAEQILYATTSDKDIRAELDKDLRERGERLSEAEIVPLFQARLEQLKQAKEADVRSALRALDPLTWAFFESRPTPRGVTFRVALELR